MLRSVPSSPGPWGAPHQPSQVLYQWYQPSGCVGPPHCLCHVKTTGSSSWLGHPQGSRRDSPFLESLVPKDAPGPLRS